MRNEGIWLTVDFSPFRLPKRASEGRSKSRKAAPAEVVAEPRSLAQKPRKTGNRRSSRAIATELARLGPVAPSGASYGSIMQYPSLLA